MQVSVIEHDGRRMAVAGYRPEIHRQLGRHYAWAANAWVPTFDPTTCLVELLPRDDPVLPGLLTAEVPDIVAAGGHGVQLLLYALDGAGSPVALLDSDVLVMD